MGLDELWDILFRQTMGYNFYLGELWDIIFI